MINYIKRKDLEVTKYDACIENSIQSRIYAFSWYLDIVADHWDVLVLDDYEAVMPIPWNQKYLLKYISQPFFCQQLGVFSKIDVSENVVNKFVSKIPFRFDKIGYQFNSKNKIDKKSNLKKNFILDLNNDYLELKLNYRKDRKNRVNQVLKKNYSLAPTTAKDIIKLSKEYYKFLNLTEKHFYKLALLIDTALKKEQGFLLGAFNESGDILGGCFFLKSKNRLIYLYSVVTNEGKKNQVASLIIDTVIQKFSNKEYILDFEGSMTSGIASFFKSFGADLEEYTFFEDYKFPRLFRIFKKQFFI
jgi:hypothetical protein